jgi:hypothetical protein
MNQPLVLKLDGWFSIFNQRRLYLRNRGLACFIIIRLKISFNDISPEFPLLGQLDRTCPSH